jgi:hypothetical protein
MLSPVNRYTQRNRLGIESDHWSEKKEKTTPSKKKITLSIYLDVFCKDDMMTFLLKSLHEIMLLSQSSAHR